MEGPFPPCAKRQGKKGWMESEWKPAPRESALSRAGQGAWWGAVEGGCRTEGTSQTGSAGGRPGS